VLKIAGRPCRDSASSSAAMQKSASIVLDSRRASTFRVAQSMIATRHRKPRRIGMQVMSAHQTWFGRLMTTFLSKYGQTLCSGCGTVVFGRW
jgi:purine nucleoside permease